MAETLNAPIDAANAVMFATVSADTLARHLATFGVYAPCLVRAY